MTITEIHFRPMAAGARPVPMVRRQPATPTRIDMDPLANIADDIRAGLDEERRIEMDVRLSEASDASARLSVLLRMSWAARGAPMLAQRVIDFGNQPR